MDELDHYLETIQQELKIMEKNLSETRKAVRKLRKEQDEFREKIMEFKEVPDSAVKSAKDRLRGLYDDYFHICNSFYGSKRDQQEECLLCLEMLSRN